MIHKADSCASDSRYSSGGGSGSCKASTGWKQNVGKVFSFFFPSLVMSNQKVYTVVFLLTQEEMWAKLKFNLVLYSFYKKR